ncbi:MAG TPA: GntG family PLP-dependent aldolase [Balneolales bacterium]|nr:GntG family PLP-dependent aldolase [Balneolales bacterium]
MIDLRSDTITKPTRAMREAMAVAEVGDDVFGDDPTVNALQEKVAAMFGMEAGLFVPSGTMSNQLALHVLTNEGDEVIIDETGHIFNYESTSAAWLSSIQLSPVKGRNGILTPEVIEPAIRPYHEWDPHTRVIALENTTNKGGGVCYTRGELKAVRELADKHGFYIHLDGARIWNASVASGIPFSFFGEIADTISVCFSKGLGAPVGSMLLSDRDRIQKAHRFRKMLGGGMRQIGILAAAADYAIEHHYDLLADDHRRAHSFASTVAECSRLQINLDRVQTNIVLFDVVDGDAGSAIEKLTERDIHMTVFGPQTIRATFHIEIGDKDLEVINQAMRELFG